MSSLPVALQSHSHSNSHSDSPPALTSLHLLPFHIAYSGPARIKGYFNPVLVSSLSNETDGTLSKAYFRGRMMLGTEIRLPAGYEGQVWKSNGPSISSVREAVTRTPKAASASTSVGEMPSYNPDSPRRSPRKHANPDIEEPAAKKQKLAVEMKKKDKKKKKVVKRERFDMSPEPEELVGQEKEMMELDMLPVEGMEAVTSGMEKKREDMKVESSLGKENDASEEIKTELDPSAVIEKNIVTPVAKTEEQGQLEAPLSSSTTEPRLPFISEASASASTSTFSPIKQERASTPPPPSSSSIPGTPSTPLGSSQPSLTINPATPKPFLLPASYDSPSTPRPDGEGDGDEGIVAQRVLKQIGKFESFCVWNPDTEVDKGEDVYVRGVAEWTQLAELIHA